MGPKIMEATEAINATARSPLSARDGHLVVHRPISVAQRVVKAQPVGRGIRCVHNQYNGQALLMPQRQPLEQRHRRPPVRHMRWR